MDSGFSAEQQLGDDNCCLLNAIDGCQGFHAKNAGLYSSFGGQDTLAAAKACGHTRFCDSILGGNEFGCISPSLAKGCGRVSNLGPVLDNDTGKLPDFSEQANGRKRKAEKGAKESEEVKAKRCKAVGHSDSENDNGNSCDSTPNKGKEKDSKLPSKDDYIHVRARRGQATDSHSLAERVRREKINERMKFLQDLVPSCNKVTGKAVMLDEIINYVQSLQHQVEFLSMKLAAVNPKLDFSINNFFPKELKQASDCGQMCGNFASQGVSPSYLPPDQFKQNSLQTLPSPGSDVPSAMSSAESAEVFADTNFQMQSPWDSELQNLIHMGFAQGRLQHYQAL